MDLLNAIIEETVRMGTPGQYYGPVIRGAGVKDQVIQCFIENFPIKALWNEEVKNYQIVHKKMTKKLMEIVTIDRIRPVEGQQRNSFPICAKLVDTFMHQLMKYERFRYLYEELFLPLDGQVFNKFTHGGILERAVEFPREIIGIANRMGA